MTGPPNATLAAPPAPVLPGPPNGDFAAGLEGWTALGREAPASAPLATGGVEIGLTFDTTVVSPPFVVPPGGQALAVAARSAGLGAALQVSARPEEGGADIPLGYLEPPTVTTTARVPLDGLAGRVVRIVLDPVPGLGRSVDLSSVGPVEVPLPEWTVLSGLPDPVGAGARRELRVQDDPLSLLSAPFAPGPAATALLVGLRGEGTVRADAGAGVVLARATAVERDVRVPVRPGAAPVALRLDATPGPAGLRLRGLGLVLRRTVLADRRAGRAGARVVVTGRLVPAGAGLRVRLLGAGGRTLATAVAGPTGAFRVVARSRGGPARLVVAGDRTRLGGGWGVRLPPPRRAGARR